MDSTPPASKFTRRALPGSSGPSGAARQPIPDPAGLDNLGLRVLSDDPAKAEKGVPAPVGSRLMSAKDGRTIFQRLRKSDEASAVSRTRIDALFDGAPPHDPAKLAATRQRNTTNVSFGLAQRLLDASMASYVDLYASLGTLMEVHVQQFEAEGDTKAQENIVAEELTALLRGWPEFHSSYLRLCTLFVKHGVGVLYFDAPTGFRFRVCGLGDFLVPRQTVASEEAVAVAVARVPYRVDELFRYVTDRKAAEAVGWDVDEVIRAINQSCAGYPGSSSLGVGSGFTTSGSGPGYEEWQSRLKNNDLIFGIDDAPVVPSLHFWVRETDGTISHLISSERGEDDGGSFMFSKVGLFPKAEQAFVFFTNGVGTNGTLHSVRGMGQRVFPLVQAITKLRCRAIDGAMLGSAIMVQPLNQRGLDELEFGFYGPYAMLSPDAKVVEKAVPNMGQVVQPVLNDATEQLLQNTDTSTAYGPDRGSPYRNSLQVASDLEIGSRINSATINLFYQSWDRAIREIVRRVLDPAIAKKDKAVAAFYKKCELRGVDAAFLKRIDPDLTTAVRSVGDGSAANRMLVHKELAVMAGQFDPMGQKYLLHDRVADLVGHKLASRYAPPPNQTLGEDRPNVDHKMAWVENILLTQGEQVPAMGHELHGHHLMQHGERASELLGLIEQGTADPVASLPALSAFYRHLSDHATLAATDPNLEAATAQTRQVLSLLEEQIHNGHKAQAAMQRQEQEQQQQLEQEGQEGQAGPEMGEGGEDPRSAAGSVDLELKMRRAELEMDIASRKAELTMAIERQKAEQSVMLRDAEVAARIRNEAMLKDARTRGSLRGVNGNRPGPPIP